MKNLIFVIAALCFSTAITTVQAQVPTQQNQPVQQGDEWTKIESNVAPTPLREALKADKYKGWESTGVYQKADKTEYYVRVGTGNSAKVFRFDVSGKEIGSNAGLAPNSDTKKMEEPKMMPDEMP